MDGFYILQNLQDSQTFRHIFQGRFMFYILQNLQDSQTQIQFQVLSELNTVTGAVSLIQIDYTIILIDNTCFFAVQFRFLHIF